MAASDYTTLAALKSSLNITETTFDTDLALAITAASRVCDDLGGPGRRFYPDPAANVSRQFWPENSGYCIIDDLNTFTSLTAQNSTWTLGTDFYLEPINAAADGRPFTAVRAFAKPFIWSKADINPGSWTGFDGRITIVGSWGWAATPEPIQTATTMIAQSIFKRMREAPYGVSSMGINDPGFAAGLSEEVYALVAAYSRDSLIA